MLNNVNQLIARDGIVEFGFESHSRVVEEGGIYRLVQHKFNIPLIESPDLKDYVGLDMYTMYTGAEFGTGDYIIEAELEDGSMKTIYTFR